MKKILVLTLCLLMFCAFSAGAVELANPITEYASLEEINELLDCQLTHPAVMGVTDERFSVIATGETFDIGEYAFSVNGMPYTLRFCADYEKDISGVYVDGAAAFDGTVYGMESLETPDMKLARWATIQGQYSLCIEDNGAMEGETFDAILIELMDMTTPMNEAEVGGVYAELEGVYQDTVSQRAVAVVIADESDSVMIMVSWSDSAFEDNFWSMDATLSEDGLLYYNNCTLEHIVYDEDGNEDNQLVYENGEGYFSPSEGKLLWNGAADENCSECVFEKIEIEG